MRDDLDVEIAELYPERRTDPEILANLRAQLFAPMKPRRDWRGAAAAAAVVLLITGIAYFFQIPEPTPSLTSAQSLDEAAARLDASAEPAGPYRHITRRVWLTRTVELPGTRWYAYSEEFLVELWVPLASGQQVKESRKATGEVRWVGGTEPETVLVSRPAAELPDAVIGHCGITPCAEPGVSEGEYSEAGDTHAPHGLFLAAFSKLSFPFTSKTAQAQVYRWLAMMPDVRYSGEWVVLDTMLEGDRLRLRVDPASGRFKGWERLAESPSRLPRDTVLESVEITEESAQTPG